MTEMVYDLSSATAAAAHWTQLLLDSNFLTPEEHQELVNAWDEYMRKLTDIEQRLAAENPEHPSLEDCINGPRKPGHAKPAKGKPPKRNPTNG